MYLQRQAKDARCSVACENKGETACQWQTVSYISSFPLCPEVSGMIPMRAVWVTSRLCLFNQCFYVLHALPLTE